MTHEDLQFQLLNAQINASSDYNDGWTKEYYKEEVIKLKNKLKSIGTQTKINFDEV